MILTKGSSEDIEAIQRIIEERIAWMDSNGLHSWHEVDYLSLYPYTYFQKKAEEGTLYVAIENCETVGAAVILGSDGRWHDDGRALYIHNLVSKLGTAGAGAFIIEETERMAAELGKECIRLHAAVQNALLLSYYRQNDFISKGTFAE